MGEGSVRNSSLIAVAHVQGVDTLEVDKGSVCNLSAPAHVQDVYTLEMNESSICNIIAAPHI